MKNVLLTNLFVERYTGSELHIIEIAKLFKEKGFQVTIATFEKAYPLLSETEGFLVINCLEEKLELEEYDLIWVQHFQVLDYLRCRYNLSYKKIIVSKLSIINDLESLPECVELADAILCVSQECADAVKGQLGENSKIEVFLNCAEQEFFDAYREKTCEKTIKNVAVISNHVPEDLYEALEQKKNEWNIEFTGAQYSTVRVNAEYLSKFDLIITIGRTVQECFAQGKVVYVYDYFGGPGYINKENIDLAEYHNYSGRGFTRLDQETLVEDIQNGYQNALADVEWLHKIAIKKYNYQIRFQQLLDEVRIDSDCEYHRIPSMDKLRNQRLKVYTDIASGAIGAENNLVSQVYWAEDGNYNESDSIKWRVYQNNPIIRNLNIEIEGKQIRFDPAVEECRCRILSCTNSNGEKLQLEPGNRTFCEEGWDVFMTSDPQYNLKIKPEDKGGICISYIVKSISKEEINNQFAKNISELELEKNKLQIEKEDVERRFIELAQSKFGKAYYFWHKIKNKFHK